MRRSLHSWAAAAVVLLVSMATGAAQAAELDLPVPRITLYPGDTIGEDHLVERAFIAHTVARATVHESRDGVVGKVAKRTLLPGQPIPVSALRDPYVVNQGKTATVVYEEGGLVISSNAMALQNGGVGDVVSLRNVDSGTIIKGTVAPDGTVRLGNP